MATSDGQSAGYHPLFLLLNHPNGDHTMTLTAKATTETMNSKAKSGSEANAAANDSLLTSLRKAAESWRVIQNHGTAEDKLKLRDHRSGFLELAALIAEDKLVLEMVDAGPDAGTLFLMANVLCLEDQRKLLEDGKLTLHFRNTAGEPDCRVIPLDCIKKNHLRAAIDVNTGRLKTKSEQLSQPSPPPARTSRAQQTNSRYPQGPVKFEERGGKNSKVLTARVGSTSITADYLTSVLQTLAEDRVQADQPTQTVALRLTEEEAEKAEKAVEQSNGKFKDVADYCRQRLLAYGAI